MPPGCFYSRSNNTIPGGRRIGAGKRRPLGHNSRSITEQWRAAFLLRPYCGWMVQRPVCVPVDREVAGAARRRPMPKPPPLFRPQPLPLPIRELSLPLPHRVQGSAMLQRTSSGNTSMLVRTSSGNTSVGEPLTLGQRCLSFAGGSTHQSTEPTLPLRTRALQAT